MAKHRDCIESVIDKMSPYEKSMLKFVVLYGNKLQGKTEGIMDSPSKLKMFGQDVTSDWVADKLDDIFIQGIGFRDALKGISRNYGKQLDKTIKDVIIKSLKVPMPMFSKDVDSEEGAIQRERWITEKLMDSFIMSMDEDARQELAKQVDSLLKEKGIDVLKTAQTSTALLTGGLSAARAILGANFYVLIAPLANLLARLAGPLSGTGVYFATGRFLWFLAGPIGWAISAVTTLPLITSLINQRRYDKFIPAVFIIGLARIAQSNE